MPRLSPSLLIKAARQSKHLPALLVECRDLPSAQNELRWLTAFAAETTKYDDPSHKRHQDARLSFKQQLTSYVRRRNRGEPLQYILGNQPFGDLEILCRKHVLIPRPETELYTTKLAGFLREIQEKPVHSGRVGLRILDMCTGSGCMALLLHAHLRQRKDVNHSSGFQSHDLQVLGLDVSPYATSLARQNRDHNIRCGKLSPDADCQVVFHAADVLRLANQERSRQDHVGNHLNPTRAFLRSVLNSPLWRQDGSWDVVISNPPYISESEFALGGTTTRSVRMFEPKLALVPPRVVSDKTDQGDIFYQHILETALQVGARVIVMEVGDSAQAARVSGLAQKSTKGDDRQSCIELWRDDGSVRIMDEDGNAGEEAAQAPEHVTDRAVVIWRGTWAAWRRTPVS